MLKFFFYQIAYAVPFLSKGRSASGFLILQYSHIILGKTKGFGNSLAKSWVGSPFPHPVAIQYCIFSKCYVLKTFVEIPMKWR